MRKLSRLIMILVALVPIDYVMGSLILTATIHDWKPGRPFSWLTWEEIHYIHPFLILVVVVQILAILIADRPTQLDHSNEPPQ